MTAIARDAVASDHLVYAWPFPIGPECDVACAEDEQVVMCPAWLVGDRLGPGHHRWRTPDPSRPVSAFFVLTAPVEVSFDLTTMFLIPMTGHPVRLRASGSLQVRCTDPGLLIAQFVGLPFDRINDGVLRSVSRSVERMLARLLIRRVAMAATPLAVTDPGMLPGIVDELIAYNPTAGAVFGVELIRMGHLTIVADDGSSPYIPLPQDNDWDGLQRGPNGSAHRDYAAAAAAAAIAQRHGDVSLVETARGRPGSHGDFPPPIPQSSPEITPLPYMQGPGPVTASGEIRPRARSPGEEPPRLPPPPMRASVEVPQLEDVTQPGVQTPPPGSMKFATGSAHRRDELQSEARGAILGIGMSPVGTASAASGEIGPKVQPGGRVYVRDPNGLMQSATVCQLLQGWYELELGHTGERIWLPVQHVVPEY